MTQTQLAQTGNSAIVAYQAHFKRGVRLYARTSPGLGSATGENKRYFAGTRRSLCEIIAHDPQLVFHLISRAVSADELKSRTGMTSHAVDKLFEDLADARLLETRTSTMALSQRFISAIAAKAKKSDDRSKDGAYAQLTHRIAPELSQSRWSAGVEDSGVALVSARQSAHIEISGDSRAVHHLFGILLASGVTHTLIAQSHTRLSPAIEFRDISAGFLRASDIGALFRSRLLELSKELSLFPLEKVENAQEIDGAIREQLLKIHFGDIDPEILARWMSDGQDHIIISEIDGALVSIGPIVFPGKTPCSRCFSLTLDEPTPDAVTIRERDDLPIVATHYISSLVAGLVLQLIDTGTCDLIGSALCIDLLSLCNTEHIPVPLHPLCGCSW
jgi:hypothetical protein